MNIKFYWILGGNNIFNRSLFSSYLYLIFPAVVNRFEATVLASGVERYFINYYFCGCTFECNSSCDESNSKMLWASIFE